jgi:hypothetical protein
MTIYDLADVFKQPSLWLREQVWAQWALLAITASLSFLLLMLLARRRRETMTGTVLADHPPESSLGGPVELAGAKLSHQGIDDSIVGGATRADMSQQKLAHTAAQPQWADTLTRLLRREIIKRDQAEARLERELAGLEAVNEQLRKRVAESSEMSERLRRKIAELTEAKEQPRDRASKPEQAGRQERDPGYEDQPPVAVETEQKQCQRCKHQKARSEFHKNASSSDGLARWCKVCKAKAAQESRQRCASVRRTSRQPSGICADAPLCALHHRQADRLKRARRRRPRDTDQSGKRTRRFRSPLSSPGLHCPKK